MSWRDYIGSGFTHAWTKRFFKWDGRKKQRYEIQFGVAFWFLEGDVLALRVLNFTDGMEGVEIFYFSILFLRVWIDYEVY